MPAKRKADAVAAASPAKRPAADGAVQPIFLVAPGAGGGQAPREIVSALSALGSVHHVFPGGGRWPSIFPNAISQNVALVEARLREVAQGARAGQRVFLVGHSFGTRVMCALVRTRGADLPPATVAERVLLFGYPLFAPKPVKEGSATCRVKPLEQLPSTLRLLFVSGANDEFLHRSDWRPAGPFGRAALTAVVQRLQCAPRAEVVTIEGAGHNALQGFRSKPAATQQAVQDALRRHVDLGEQAGASSSPPEVIVLDSSAAEPEPEVIVLD